MELINVPYIFHDPLVKACLPTDIKFGDPTVVYSLMNPIRFKIFKVTKIVSNLDVKFFLQDNIILPCNCAGSDFMDSDYGHLEIIN